MVLIKLNLPRRNLVNCFSGPLAVTRRIIRKEGIAGLYRGFAPTLAREMPGYFFFFGTYELARECMTPVGKTKDDLGPLATAVAGGLGGAAIWTATFPFDVVKSRIQIGHLSSVPSSSQGSGRFLHTLMEIVRNEGENIGLLKVGVYPSRLLVIIVFFRHQSALQRPCTYPATDNPSDSNSFCDC